MTSRFGDAVKTAREQRGWSKSELAERSGIARKTLTRWELGEITEPLLSQLRDVIAAMQIPPDDLLRPLGLLPAEEGEPRDDLDPEEQAIWDLGVRRNWPEEMRWEFIDLYRLRKAREERTGRRSVADVEAELAALQEAQERGSHRSSA